jgi:hypothetical protein
MILSTTTTARGGPGKWDRNVSVQCIVGAESGVVAWSAVLGFSCGLGFDGWGPALNRAVLAGRWMGLCTILYFVVFRGDFVGGNSAEKIGFVWLREVGMGYDIYWQTKNPNCHTWSWSCTAAQHPCNAPYYLLRVSCRPCTIACCAQQSSLCCCLLYGSCCIVPLRYYFRVVCVIVSVS